MGADRCWCIKAVIFLICLAIVIYFVIKIGGSGGMAVTCSGVNCLHVWPLYCANTFQVKFQNVS